MKTPPLRIIHVRHSILLMSTILVLNWLRQCSAFRTSSHRARFVMLTFKEKQVTIRSPRIRLFTTSFDDPTGDGVVLDGPDHVGRWEDSHGERPLPPILESSQSYHGTIYNEEFGAVDYDEFEEMNDETTLSLQGESILGVTSLFSEESKPLAEDGTIPSLFSEPDNSSPKSVSAWSRKSSLHPDLEQSNEVSTSQKQSITAFLGLQTPPMGIERGDGSDEIYIKGSSGNGITTDIEALKEKLKSVTVSIYRENNGEEFNINSNKQLSKVLFGHPDESTDKDALYAIASAGNKIADLVLMYRRYKVDIRKMERKTINKEKGVYVTSAINHANTDSSRDPLILVDASAYIFRAYYSMPPFHRADGTPVGAVLGFCNMLNKLILNRLLAGEEPRMVLVFDPNGKNFRHDLYPEYKANRKECPMDLKPQFALIREAAKAYGIHELEATGYEADDVIATLVTMAMKEGVDCHILSGDKDLMQLITPLERTNSYVHVIDPMSMTRVDYDAVVEKWGVGPELIGDLLAIVGDTSDNIPGIKGLGPKTGTFLLNQFKSLETILANPGAIEKKAQRMKIEANIDIARLSRQLVELVRDIPREAMTFPEDCLSIADLRMKGLAQERLLKFYDQMGFRDLKKRLEGRLSGKAVTSRTKRNTWKSREKATVPQPEDFDDVPF